MAETDYFTECGSQPLSFMQMLASTIMGYADLAGVTHYRINTLEATDVCTENGDILACTIQGRDPERILVENVFALDDCGYLALKVFVNQSTWIDYDVCADPIQNLYQLLARAIVSYQGHYRLNVVQDTNHCDDLVDLLNCTTNDIEAERRLAENIFAVDDCGRLAVKLFINVGSRGEGTAADYTMACAQLPESFISLLARTIVLYDGHYYLNILEVSPLCTDLTAFWACNINHISPERALAENVFSTDACGHLALKDIVNQGDLQ